MHFKSKSVFHLNKYKQLFWANPVRSRPIEFQTMALHIQGGIQQYLTLSKTTGFIKKTTLHWPTTYLPLRHTKRERTKRENIINCHQLTRKPSKYNPKKELHPHTSKRCLRVYLQRKSRRLHYASINIFHFSCNMTPIKFILLNVRTTDGCISMRKTPATNNVLLSSYTSFLSYQALHDDKTMH